MRLFLKKSELTLLIEALHYCKKAKQEYGYYPTPELKVAQVAEVDSIIHKLQHIQKEAKT